MTCMWESSLLWSVMEWGMLDCVAPLIGTKLQCLVLIKSIVIVTSWSSRNIWWSKTDRALTYIQSAGMLRGVRHKFREIFCTNDCFIFPENSLSYFCKTKPRQWKAISLCRVSLLYYTQSTSKWFWVSNLDGFFISSFYVLLEYNCWKHQNSSILWINFRSNQEESRFLLVTF